MTLTEDDLPTNRKFGAFFGGVFAVLAAYQFYVGAGNWAWLSVGLALVFATLAFVAPDLLRGPNKAWAMLGRGLGLVFGTITLGIVFYLILTPMALVTRAAGRDELRLKSANRPSHWRNRQDSTTDFQRQY